MMMMIIRLVWGILGHYSLSKEKEVVVDLGRRIRESYAKASVEPLVNTGGIYAHITIYTGRLMVPATGTERSLSVFEYCDHIHANIPADVLELINEFSLCPDNYSKRCAVVR